MNPGVPSPARRQSGVLTRGQALAAGLTAHQVRWRIEQGSWRTLHRGVYLTNAGVVTWSARAWAALLWAGPGGVLALEAAARVGRLQPDEPRIITVGVPAGHGTRTADGVRTVQRGRLASQRVDGLPVTRAAQTVLDLADRPGCSLDDAVALAARACHLGRATAQTLLADLGARGRHRHRAGWSSPSARSEWVLRACPRCGSSRASRGRTDCRSSSVRRSRPPVPAPT